MIRILIIVFLFLPSFVHGEVVLNEIAWMGTEASASDEWIEIYNESEAAVDLTGWTLTSNDGKIALTLAGTLSSYRVAVLERTDDSTLSNISAFQIYTGDLVNSGATLTLKDGTGAIIDEVVGGVDWTGIGGSNVIGNKMTAQRTPTGTWITSTPTPGAINTSSHEIVETDEEDTTHKTTTTSSHTKSNGGGASKKSLVKAEIVPGVLSVSITAPKIVYVNETVEFAVEPKGVGATIMSSLKYAWNFGDTYTGEGKKPTHTFLFPGEYIIVTEASFAKQSARARHEITVLPASFELSRDGGGNINIKNKATQEVDLGGFTLQGKQSFTFPKLTFIKPNGMLTMGHERIGRESNKVILSDTKKVQVATLNTEVLYNNQNQILPKVVKNEPLVKESVTTPTVANVEKSNDSDALPTETSNIIQIGVKESDIHEKSRGIFGRFLDRVTALFN